MVVAIQIRGMESYGKVLKKLITDKGFKVAEFARSVGLVRSRLNAAFNWRDVGEVQREVLEKVAPKIGFSDADELDTAIRRHAGLPPSLAEQLRELTRQTREIEKKPPSEGWLGKETPEPGTRVKPIPGGNELVAGKKLKNDVPNIASGINDLEFLPGELWPYDDAAFWIRVSGNSMWPKFNTGDVVIGSPALQDQVEEGDAVCVYFKPESEYRGSRMLKFIHLTMDSSTVELRSNNPDHDPFTVNVRDIEAIGPVVVHICFPGKTGGWDLSAMKKRPRVKGPSSTPLGEGPQEFPNYDVGDDKPKEQE